MYKTTAEAEQKLLNTVVSHQGEPVMIGGATGNDNDVSITWKLLGGDKWNETKIDSPEFDFINVGSKLGYINTRFQDFYCSIYSRRVPVRKAHSTQGLSQSNVMMSCNIDKYSMNIGRAPSVNFSNYSNPSSGFKETFKNLYPTMSFIRKSIGSDKFLENAVNRYLCISKDLPGLVKLMYKNQEIGWSEDMEQFKILPEYHYLGEMYDEVGIRVK